MIHAIPQPTLPAIDPNAAATPGISAVAVLPQPGVPSRALAINLMRTDPGFATMTHHHGELDTTLYVIEGTMAFHCGTGLRESVAAGPGCLASIDPHAVHAEYNPDHSQPSLGITARDTQGMFIVPCEAPASAASHGITVLPPDTASATKSDAVLAPLGAHHLRVRRLALDRLSLERGVTLNAPSPGEAAVCVLSGTARIVDRGRSDAAEGAAGTWWFLEPGTHWAVEGDAELLVIRSDR